MPQPGLLTLQTTATIFTPSVGTASGLTMGNCYGKIVSLPAVDANNTSMTLLNAGAEPVLVSFGMATAKPFSDAVGTSEIVVPPGGPYLLTGPAFSAAGVASTACISSRSGSANITFQRGNISSAELFS